MSKKTREAREAKRQRQIEEFGGLRNFECPQCSKHRMTRPHDHIVSREQKPYDTYSGETIELYSDVCDFCMRRNQAKYFEPSQADLKKVLKAMQQTGELEEGQSLEDIL